MRYQLNEFGRKQSSDAKCDTAKTPPYRLVHEVMDFVLGFSTEDFANRITDARTNLLSIWPEAFTKALGADAANQGTCSIFEMFQSEALNKHLLYTLLDAMIDILIESSTLSPA
jgi:hypothetical protein